MGVVLPEVGAGSVGLWGSSSSFFFRGTLRILFNKKSRLTQVPKSCFAACVVEFCYHESTWHLSPSKIAAMFFFLEPMVFPLVTFESSSGCRAKNKSIFREIWSPKLDMSFANAKRHEDPPSSPWDSEPCPAVLRVRPWW